MGSSNSIEKKRVTKARRTSVPITLDGGNPKKRPFMLQGTTWAGILSIGAAIATGGASVLTDPVLLQTVGAGIALLVAEN